MSDTDKHDAELAHERVISADLRKDFRALQAQAAARDEEIARLQRHAAILEQHKVAASAHGRELFNRVVQQDEEIARLREEIERLCNGDGLES